QRTQVAGARREVSAVRPSPNPNVVLIGDSHAWLWGSLDGGVMPDLAEPGLTSTQIEPQVHEALAMHPRYIVISAGTNDLAQGRNWQVPAANLRTMVSEIRQAGVTPIVLVIPSFSTMATAPWITLGLIATSTASVVDLGGGSQLPQLNAAIGQLGTPLLNAPGGETIDGVHLDRAAYAVLDQQLKLITG
ncbi:MAG TPA: GDSL-type esterase/lipase family protein, partial [Actinomycetota bacterium]|nr:GDSL-type esterase/lipase family protein [Actinomycetota bacterium]